MWAVELNPSSNSYFWPVNLDHVEFIKTGFNDKVDKGYYISFKFKDRSVTWSFKNEKDRGAALVRIIALMNQKNNLKL